MGVMMAGGPRALDCGRSPEILWGQSPIWGSFCPQSLFVQKEEAFGGERRQAEDRYEEREKGRARKGKTMKESHGETCVPKWSHRVTRAEEVAAQGSDFWPVLDENFLHSGFRLTCIMCTHT